MDLRAFENRDASVLSAVSMAAFSEYAKHYTDWPVFSRRITDIASLAASGEVVVAELGGVPVGTVAYFGPSMPKLPFFEPEWATMRMLVVHPKARGLGIGRALAEECLRRGERDKARTFALHTSELMSVALPMYLRLGFSYHRPAPEIFGVKYNIYTRSSAAEPFVAPEVLQRASPASALG
jgi:GNAT superfamily N-acetyltransferase